MLFIKNWWSIPLLLKSGNSHFFTFATCTIWAGITWSKQSLVTYFIINFLSDAIFWQRRLKNGRGFGVEWVVGIYSLACGKHSGESANGFSNACKRSNAPNYTSHCLTTTRSSCSLAVRRPDRDNISSPQTMPDHSHNHRTNSLQRGAGPLDGISQFFLQYTASR